MKRAVPLNFWGKMFLKLDRISASIEAHNLIPQTCEYITLYYKNDVAGVLKFMDLEMGWLSQNICMGISGERRKRRVSW